MDIYLLREFIGSDEAGNPIVYVIMQDRFVVMKVHPSDGSEIWTDINPNSTPSWDCLLTRWEDDYIYSWYWIGQKI